MGQDWITPSIIATLLASAINIYYNDRKWKIDKSEKKAATIYFPLLFACKGIIQVIDEYKNMNLRNMISTFQSSAKILDEIVYKHGSIIHLEAKDLKKFELLFFAINRNINFFTEKNIDKIINSSNNNREKINKDLEDKIGSKEFTVIREHASILRDLCKKEVEKLSKGEEKGEEDT